MVQQSNGSSNEAGFISIGRNLSYKMDSDDNVKNPISEIIYAISPPCSNLNIDYVARPTFIDRQVRDRQGCTKNPGEIVEHSLFYKTSFAGISELNVYKQNGNLL